MIRSHYRMLLSLAASLPLLIPCVGVAQDSEIDELTRLHRELTTAKRIANDTVLLSAIALDDYVVVPPGGLIENRTEAIQGVRNFTGDSIEVVVDMVTRHDSTAVLLGTVTGNGGVRGPVPQFAKIRFMAVYVRTEGAWRLLAQSNTPCQPMAIQRGRC